MAVKFELSPELRSNFPYLEPPKWFDPLDTDMVRPPCTILERAVVADEVLARETYRDTKCANGLALVQSPPDGKSITVISFMRKPEYSSCTGCIVFERYGYLIENSVSLLIPQPAHQ